MSTVVPGRDGFVRIEDAHRLAFSCGRNLEGKNLVAEDALRGGGGGTGMRLGREDVLIDAGDTEFFGDHLGGGAHVVVVVGVPQTVVDHGVEERAVAHAIA